MAALEAKTDPANMSQMKLNSLDFRERMSVVPLIIVVFGASGHLAKTKTFPALFDLFKEGVFPDGTMFIGSARSAKPDDEFANAIVAALEGSDKNAGVDADTMTRFRQSLSYVQLAGYTDDESFDRLGAVLNERSNEGSNRLFYFALPPSVYADVGQRCSRSCFGAGGFNRVIIEKPFGKDYNSCEELLAGIGEFIPEMQLYRIDHYLAKEMAQNILTLRFGNTIWDYLWHRNAIKCVKISFKEAAGVEGRGGYYDEFGAIRDIFQNHLMQVLTLIAMEAPVTLHANDVRDEKVKVLKAIQPPKMNNELFDGQPREVMVGQYVAGNGQPGYREDPSVADDSNQVTFLQTVLHINNGRWQGVPFICKCGKGLDRRRAEVRIQFKQEGLHLFPNVAPNELVIRLQPNESMYLKINTKVPGFAHFNEATSTELDISYSDRFEDLHLPNAYSRLIADALRGDQALFVRADELLESWRIVTPILDKLGDQELEFYERGSRGPDMVDDMAAAHGFFRDEDYQWPKRVIPETKL